MVMVTGGHAPGAGTGHWSQTSVHTLEGIWRKPRLSHPEMGLPGWLPLPVLASVSLNYSLQHVRSPRDPVNTLASFQTSPRAIIYQEQRERSPPPATWPQCSSLTSRVALTNGDLP